MDAAYALLWTRGAECPTPGVLSSGSANSLHGVCARQGVLGLGASSHPCSTCQGGHWLCSQYKCAAECAVLGNPHYVTFDRKRYSFHGACEYILVQVRGWGHPPGSGGRCWVELPNVSGVPLHLG